MDSPRVNLDDWRLLAQVSQIFRTASDTFADQVDISRGQATVLCTVAKQDGMTQSEIAEALSVQGATVSNMLGHLEEAGLVIRQRDATDNRLVRVYLTSAGCEKERSLNEVFAAMQDQLFAGIREEERESLRGYLLQIIRNITKEEQ